MSQYIISTARLGLRQWADADIQPFAELNADTAVMKYFPATLSTDETIAMVARIKQSFDTNGFCLYAVELSLQ